MAEGVPALRIKTAAFGQPHFHLPGQGNVHVVATQQQMIPDRHPFELELGFACGYGNQAQVSGTAAHVTH